jgi:general secretion pathway protein K
MIAANHAERGLALVTAMLVVAIVATAAAGLALGQQVWLRQTQNIADRAQSESLRRGALAWISVMLERDARDDNIDHLGEPWARVFPPLPFEGGVIAVAISDAQARFNLNNLVRNGAPSVADIGVFQRLLRSLELDPSLSEALIDWIDPDTQARPGGAEDVDYLALAPPYRAANQPLASVDELRLVKGFTAEAVERLRPYVAALPEPTAININTASERVLAALLPGASPAVQPIIQAREREPFKAVGDLTKLLSADQPPPQAAHGVNSGYFLVTIDIRFGWLQRRSEALIHRPAGGKPATVLWHGQQYRQPVHEEEQA